MPRGRCHVDHHLLSSLCTSPVDKLANRMCNQISKSQMRHTACRACGSVKQGGPGWRRRCIGSWQPLNGRPISRYNIAASPAPAPASAPIPSCTLPGTAANGARRSHVAAARNSIILTTKTIKLSIVQSCTVNINNNKSSNKSYPNGNNNRLSELWRLSAQLALAST